MPSNSLPPLEAIQSTVEYLREIYAERADPLCATLIKELHIDPLIPPTVKTL